MKEVKSISAYIDEDFEVYLHDKKNTKKLIMPIEKVPKPLKRKVHSTLGLFIDRDSPDFAPFMEMLRTYFTRQCTFLSKLQEATCEQT